MKNSRHFSIPLLVAVVTILSSFLSSVIAQDKVPVVDLSPLKDHQVVIAAGTPEIYQGHPTSILMDDGKTIFVVWTIGHGGTAGPSAKSVDGGLTWERIDDRMPEGYFQHRNCPSIYRLFQKDGKSLIWVFSAQPKMPRILSQDDGETWTEEEPIGFDNVMTFSSIVEKNPGVRDGKYIAFFHHLMTDEGEVLNEEPPVPSRLQQMMTETDDAGWTWSEPKLVADFPKQVIHHSDGTETVIPKRDPCEGFGFWSPDKKELCCLMRDNTHQGKSLVMFSRDKGETWTKAVDSPWELSGDRHVGTYLPDGRLFIAFRDMAPNSPTRGHFLGWVGTYDDIKNGRPGQYRVKLLHSYSGSDCGYPGVHVLGDGSVIALTYIKYEDNENAHSVVAVKFTMDELDRMAKEIASKEKEKGE